MEVPRWNSDIGQVYQSNAMEDRKLKIQISRINSAKKEQLGKIDQEMTSLKKQLLKDRKLLGTRSDIKRRKDRNANNLEQDQDQNQLSSSVQPKLMGLPKAEVTESKLYRPLQERFRHEIAARKYEIKTRPSRLVSIVREKSDNFRKEMSLEVEKVSPSCSTPSPSCRGRRHSIAEINLSDSFRKICTPQTSSGNATTRNANGGGGVTGGKLDHPLLRQRRASVPNALITEQKDYSVASPKLKPIRFAPDKLAVDADNKASQSVKLGNFNRHIEGSNLRWKRRNSLPNFDSLPSNRDSLANKERLTARLVSRTKPASTRQRNMSPNKRTSAFGKQFKKNSMPVTEQTNEEDCNDQEDIGSLRRMSQDEDNEDRDKKAESTKELSVAQELSFIPKATLQEKMDNLFSDWVGGCDEERTDMEELLQEFRREKKEGRQEINAELAVESNVAALETSHVESNPLI